MNFFASQDKAKRNTTKLVVLFALAVLSLIGVTNLLVMLALGFASTGSTSMAGTGSLEFSWEVFFSVGVFVTGVILLGSLYKMAALSGGGARVAEMMNARLIVPGSGDLNEQRVLNVVEEMAIASGTPVPPVYLMEEAGINAFAAGYTPSDAVIAVTRGTINTLTRDQLQGVIGHEFSHILHGDMRINIRLIGVLHGIMVLGLIGYHLMRSSMYSRRSKNGGGLVMLGLGLTIVGFMGTFFGNLIKAAVSRQREFLADASAVQYTRNPEGIAGALMQIARHSKHSYLANPSSAEISHALFEEGSHSALSGLYATHPPLEQRIAAILPGWDGSYDLVDRPSREHVRQSADAGARTTTQRERAETLLKTTTGVLMANAMIDQVGNPEIRHLQHADALLRDLPRALHEAAQSPASARALIYLLVLDSEATLRQRQLFFLQDFADRGVFGEVQRLEPLALAITPEQRLPLITIALSGLRQLSQPQYLLFKDNFGKLIGLDKKISLFEWALQKIVFQHLEAIFGKKSVRTLGNRDLNQVAKSARLLVSLLAHSNPQRGITAAAAYERGAELLGLHDKLLPLEDINFDRLNVAVDELVTLKPLQKPALLKACAACIFADSEIAAIEAELLRAIAAALDCPMPPLVVQE
jgi:Zn-dependent protease with chaperone function